MATQISEYAEQMLVKWWTEANDPRFQETGYENQVYIGLGEGSVVTNLEKAGMISYTKNNYYRITEEGQALAKQLQPKWEHNLPRFEDTEP